MVNWVMEHSVSNSADTETCEKMKRFSRIEDGRLVAYLGPKTNPLY